MNPYVEFAVGWAEQRGPSGTSNGPRLPVSAFALLTCSDTFSEAPANRDRP
ncbi:hypothetical protein KL86DES1_10832 [uncultured Desulfovibrio sp.]|uniref:Uncharacterized protein n=1 Tax=uncultured Desulfovibrio sp. TaxID=167968 RepID=A0A212L0J9_9BACT|nr:hypothetical protein KL86DES1_10832 [uncultured Desulfovibrio sp.]VZH32705.1 conserved protein of unknown function [Desulfovibrio sp. 86]